MCVGTAASQYRIQEQEMSKGMRSQFVLLFSKYGAGEKDMMIQSSSFQRFFYPA